jgi:hypothetical protein
MRKQEPNPKSCPFMPDTGDRAGLSTEGEAELLRKVGPSTPRVPEPQRPNFSPLWEHWDEYLAWLKQRFPTKGD